MVRGGLARGTLVLDADGFTKLAKKDVVARSYYQAALDEKSLVVTAASTLAEVLRGGRGDVPVHRVLKKVEVVGIDPGHGRAAGELLGRLGLSGHQHAMDALLAVVALAQPRPVVVLTSDPRDLAVLTDEPYRPRSERIKIVKI